MKDFETVLYYNKDDHLYENSNFKLCYTETSYIFRDIRGYSSIKVKFSKKPFKDSKAFRFLKKGLYLIKENDNQFHPLYTITRRYLESLGIRKGQHFYINITGEVYYSYENLRDSLEF